MLRLLIELIFITLIVVTIWSFQRHKVKLETDLADYRKIIYAGDKGYLTGRSRYFFCFEIDNNAKYDCKSAVKTKVARSPYISFEVPIGWFSFLPQEDGSLLGSFFYDDALGSAHLVPYQDNVWVGFVEGIEERHPASYSRSKNIEYYEKTFHVCFAPDQLLCDNYFISYRKGS